MAYGDGVYTAVVDEYGEIWEMVGYQKSRKLGVDIHKEKELLQTIEEIQEPLDNYYNKLIEIRKYLIDVYNDKDMVNQLSAFAPVISAEQIAKEAAEEQIRLAQDTASEQLRMAQEQAYQQSIINNELLDAIKKLSGEVANLKQKDDIAIIEIPIEKPIERVIPKPRSTASKK